MTVDLTTDQYLDGRVSVVQPAKGYRAGTDAVMLAAAVDAKRGEHVLELGCGAGVASACLHARVPDCHIVSVERNSFYAELARKNLKNIVVEADLTKLPTPFSEQSFDHVMFNPPFFPSAGKGEHKLKEVAHVEDTPLRTWIEVAARRLKPRGQFVVIHRTDRLADLMVHMGGFGDVTLLPIVARAGREPKRFIVSARKGTSGPSRICPNFVMHDGDQHLGDGDDYSEQARTVLRNGQPIVMKK